MTRVIFLDRDGVINKYPGDYLYVDSVDKFKFLPGSKEAIVQLYKAGYILFVISNQAGVTKGIYSQKALDEITEVMIKGIQGEGGQIQKVLYCIHTDKENCGCRKPKAGSLFMATKDMGEIDKLNSFFIGDSLRDVKAGKSFGCKTILVLTGRQKLADKDSWDVEPDFIAEDLTKAVELVLKK
ncbi:D-glycero-alpha-D-manno-heptose-1,7-bisphosphate 7-phosphatase [Thermoproteota archaeon]